MTEHAWGRGPTEFFFQLTPDQVLDAVESLGFRCTGRCIPLNSMENRVYEVEIEEEESATASAKKKSRWDAFKVVKFYRPGRWNDQQILDEHQFLLDLKENEIPVVAPIEFEHEGSRKTMGTLPSNGIRFALFPRVGGRAPDELEDVQLQRIGRLLARIHNTGKIRAQTNRVHLTPDTYGISNLEFLLEKGTLPPTIKTRYETLVREICSLSAPRFERVSSSFQRIHGDCHLGNLLWNDEGPFFLDFDDMVMGPPIQDLWLICPGRDEIGKKQFNVLLDAYSELTDFNELSLCLVESLRALRFVHFHAWITKRWEDPAFPKAFPAFGSMEYWNEQLENLQEQLGLIRVGNFGM